MALSFECRSNKNALLLAILPTGLGKHDKNIYFN